MGTKTALLALGTLSAQNQERSTAHSCFQLLERPERPLHLNERQQHSMQGCCPHQPDWPAAAALLCLVSPPCSVANAKNRKSLKHFPVRMRCITA